MSYRIFLEYFINSFNILEPKSEFTTFTFFNIYHKLDTEVTNAVVLRICPVSFDFIFLNLKFILWQQNSYFVHFPILLYSILYEVTFFL